MRGGRLVVRERRSIKSALFVRREKHTFAVAHVLWRGRKESKFLCALASGFVHLRLHPKVLSYRGGDTGYRCTFPDRSQKDS